MVALSRLRAKMHAPIDALLPAMECSGNSEPKSGVHVKKSVSKEKIKQISTACTDLYLVILFLYQDADLFPGPFEVRRGKHVVKLFQLFPRSVVFRIEFENPDRNVFQPTFHNFQHICREIVVR